MSRLTQIKLVLLIFGHGSPCDHIDGKGSLGAVTFLCDRKWQRWRYVLTSYIFQGGQEEAGLC